MTGLVRNRMKARVGSIAPAKKEIQWLLLSLSLVVVVASAMVVIVIVNNCHGQLKM